MVHVNPEAAGTPTVHTYSNSYPGTEEQPTSSDKSLTNLPDFFSKCHFFLYGNFSPSDRRLLVRYITAYNGLAA